MEIIQTIILETTNNFLKSSVQYDLAELTKSCSAFWSCPVFTMERQC